MSRALTKQKGLEQVKHLLLSHPEGVEFGSIVKLLDMDASSAWRYLKQLGARKIERGLYTLDPSAEDRKLARAVLERDVPAGDWQKVCPNCDRPFRTDNHRTVYCSEACQKSAQNQRYYEVHRAERIEAVRQRRKAK